MHAFKPAGKLLPSQVRLSKFESAWRATMHGNMQCAWPPHTDTYQHHTTPACHPLLTMKQFQTTLLSTLTSEHSLNLQPLQAPAATQCSTRGLAPHPHSLHTANVTRSTAEAEGVAAAASKCTLGTAAPQCRQRSTEACYRWSSCNTHERCSRERVCALYIQQHASYT